MASEPSFGSALHEVNDTLKRLVRSELDLLKSELAETGMRFSARAVRAAIFAALLALSIFPFLAFLVIGLGQLLGDRYWLGALIVSVVCAVVGGALAYRFYRSLRTDDMKLPHTRKSFKRTMTLVQKGRSR
jgi:hypothetical protein